MIGTIRRHQNWLWIVIITVTILSFVIFFSPNVKLGDTFRRTRASAEFGSINGQPISPDEYFPAETEARINYFLRHFPNWPDSAEATRDDLKRDTIFRVFLIHKLQEFDIHASDDAVARLARERLGKEVVDNLGRFHKEYFEPARVSMEDLGQYLRHEAGIQELVQVAASSAKLLNPREAEQLYRKDNEQLDTQVALFSASNYLAKVTVTPDAITNFYKLRAAKYRVPERVQVAYVEFSATNFLAEADKQLNQRTNVNAIVDEEYLRRGPESFKNDKGEKLPEAEAKAKLKEDIRHNLGLLEAYRKAAEFGNQLYNQQVTQESVFETLATTNGLAVKVTPPFDEDKGLENGDFPPQFRQRALSLTNQQQAVSFSPIRGTNAVYLIALKNKIPSELPPLEKIRDEVTADYKYSQAVDLARKAGAAFNTSVTNALAQKKPFAEVAAATNVPLINVPPFTPSTGLTNVDSRINPRMLQNYADNLKPDQASPFIPSQDGGMLIYMRERVPVSDAKLKQDLPEFLTRLRVYRQNEAFNQWFRRAAEQAKLTVPQKESIQPSSATAPRAATTPRAAAK